jgi:hypothetical protein
VICFWASQAVWPEIYMVVPPQLATACEKPCGRLEKSVRGLMYRLGIAFLFCLGLALASPTA